MQRMKKVYVALFLATAPNIAIAAETNDDPAVVAIDAAIQSMKQHPNQFNVQLNCTGVQATATAEEQALASLPMAVALVRLLQE